MKFFVAVLLMLFCYSFKGEAQELILTKAQDEAWGHNLKELPFDQQLLSIRQRLLADTNVFNTNNGDRLMLKSPEERNKLDGSCKFLLYINKSHIVLYNSSRTKPKKVKALCLLLNDSNIKTIKVLAYREASEIFGCDVCSVVLLDAKNKRFIKQVKRLGYDQQLHLH